MSKILADSALRAAVHVRSSKVPHELVKSSTALLSAYSGALPTLPDLPYDYGALEPNGEPTTPKAAATSTPKPDFLTKLKSMLGIEPEEKQPEVEAPVAPVMGPSIDKVGLPIVGKIAAEQANRSDDAAIESPRVVMCSSAGVTRPAWDDAKEELMPGAADIPIVRLNPFGILDIKRQSEELLRETGCSYCIVRPAGLKDGTDWPTQARPVFSQGDVAVGRIHRQDVAELLVECLLAPDAVGKTFEVVTLAGYPPATSLDTSLQRLLPDHETPLAPETVAAYYATMQQLLPGEQQNAAALAMGQTYEELDQGKTGRLGKRGQEVIQGATGATPQPTASE